MRVKLRLDSLDGRIVPSTTYTSPPDDTAAQVSQPDALTANATSVLDFNTVSSSTSYTMTITIVSNVNTANTLPPFTVGANTSPTAVAAAVTAAINQSGWNVTATQNGTTVTVTAPNGYSVKFNTTGGDPNMKPATLSTTQSGSSIFWNNTKLRVAQIEVE